MNQQADGAMRNSRGPMRAFVFAAALAVLTLSATGLASVASAQSNPTPRPETPAPRPDTQGRAPEAPIGIGNPARRNCRPASSARKAPGPPTKRRWTRSWKSVAGAERLRIDVAYGRGAALTLSPSAPSLASGRGTLWRRLRFDMRPRRDGSNYRLRRYSVGVRPACLRNAVANELASPKPRSSPICVTGKAGVAKRFLAFSMRRLTR